MLSVCVIIRIFYLSLKILQTWKVRNGFTTTLTFTVYFSLYIPVYDDKMPLRELPLLPYKLKLTIQIQCTIAIELFIDYLLNYFTRSFSIQLRLYDYYFSFAFIGYIYANISNILGFPGELDYFAIVIRESCLI